jgi:carboxypeptidase Taq
MEAKLKELKQRLSEVIDLQLVDQLLSWDQSTYMPPGGAEARGRQMAILGRIAQEKLIDPAIGRLLDGLQAYAESLPYDSDDAAYIRVARRTYERAIKVPPAFLMAYLSHSAASYQAWTVARPENNFAAVRPMLEKTLDFSRQFANFFPGYESIADPLIALADYGMKASIIRPLFANLREQLVPIVKAISAQTPADDSCLRHSYPEDQQMAIGKEIVRLLGYDFNRGRVDKTHHPFMTKFSLGDVRITTRFQEKFLGESLFSVMHEAGHAMYEQGIRRDFEASPLGDGTSAGVHESQSRLWENIVGRSLGFWKFTYPRLQAAFPSQLGATSLDTFYRAINKVQPSLVRTDADEVTYNLHVMIRFDLELDLLEGRLEIRDLPEAWNARYQRDLGVVAPDNRDGVLQDVHWYGGQIGGVFQGYTLGNIYGALFYASALQAYPEIPAQIEQGQFDTLRGWLIENVYQHGSKFTAGELVQRITGGGLTQEGVTIQPYIQYLRSKYGQLYAL